MNGILGWISRQYDSLLQTVGLKKTPPPIQTPDNNTSHTLSQGETLQVKSNGSGSAQPSLGNSVQTQMQQWKAAAKGTPIPEIQTAVRAGKSPTIALSEYLNRSGQLNREQRNQIASFMEQVMKHGSVSDSRDSRLLGRNLIDVMTDGVREQGITREQLDLLANGDFTLPAYLGLVKDGQSIV
jgi:hypothetical protein